jgi:NAD(P)-dependent dehydrogenase (short-subunit alcohol dehydrogenase family)
MSTDTQAQQPKQEKPGLEARMTPKPSYEARQYKASGKLEGRKALITGGDSGIGRAVAVIYAKEGADVAITYLPEEQVDAEETREAVEREGRKCVLIPGDLTDRMFCSEVVERSVQELGGLDILISNAAYQNRKESLEEIEDEEWDHTFRTNVYSYFFLVKAALPHLKPGSSIIATSSVNGFEPSESLPDYSATKGAINAFTKSISQMLIKKGIRVNAVAPGPVLTPLNPADQGMDEEGLQTFGQSVPMKRPAQPEEIAPAFVFFASEADSSYITGVILPELGGDIAGGP